HGPAFAAVGYELALLRQRVLGEVARVALRGVASPVDNQVRPILYFAERARNLAAQLGSDLRWAVSERGMAVDHPPDELGQRHSFTLRFACDIAEAVDERHVGVVKEFRRRLDRIIDRGRPSIDERVREEAFRGVVLEPGFTEDAGSLGLDDALGIGV